MAVERTLSIIKPDAVGANRIGEIEDFDDDPAHCGEKILEAIQMMWIEEKG